MKQRKCKMFVLYPKQKTAQEKDSLIEEQVIQFKEKSTLRQPNKSKKIKEKKLISEHLA